MRVSVFGLGYVGSVSAACFAEDGHEVVGVDVAAAKVQSLNEGRSPIVEKGLDELIRGNTANGRLRATTSTAEMMKYASNTWHALKVTFANEICNVCKRVGIDSHEVMNIFCKDEKLNLSSYYMKPGFAFGGSCLPKDVRALQYRAKEVDLEMPVIQSILHSNQLQIQHAIDEIVETGKKRIGLLGFSFKAGTDDLRESPIVILAEALLGKGHALRIYDRNVSIARLVGANKDYINTQIPHLSSLLCETIDEVVDNSDVIVVGNAAPEFSDALKRTRPDQLIVDLVRVKTDRTEIPAQYQGICW